MEAKRVAMMGLMTAAAGAGAYFLFARRFEPQRRRIADSVRSNAKVAVDEVSRVVGQSRRTAKTALKDVAEMSSTAANNL
jgi:hypothetical protein